MHMLRCSLIVLMVGGAACASTHGTLQTTSLDEVDCIGNYNLCSIQRSGNCPALSTSFSGLNVVGSKDIMQMATTITVDGDTVPTTCCTFWGSTCSSLLGASAVPVVAPTLADLSDASTCGGWLSWMITHANKDNMVMGCTDANCLARSVAYEFSMHTPDAATFENLAFPNYQAYQESRQLDVAPTVIDFNRISKSVVPVWPEASC